MSIPARAQRPHLADLALAAGRLVLDIYAQDFAVRLKSQDSPVTEADERAEALILEGLRAVYPGVPVVAEEAVAAKGAAAIGARFLLVDPLDGTKEFIRKTGEFTVNIALVDNGAPVEGCVYAPARGDLYWTQNGAAFHAAGVDPGFSAFDKGRRLRVGASATPARAAISRDHSDVATEAFLAEIGPCAAVPKGSSLKIVDIATGEIDLYPRFGPTMEWDIAAGHAVLLAAGGDLFTASGEPLRYGRADHRNPAFLACGSTAPPSDWMAAFTRHARG
jgi:3'(2'), 5'-bisphosphate nucleotidase